MHNLRDALGKDEPVEISSVRPANSIRTIRSNNSQSMWSVGVGSDDQGEDQARKEEGSAQKLIAILASFESKGVAPNEQLVKRIMGGKEGDILGQHSEKDKVDELLKKLQQARIQAPSSLEPFTSRLIEAAQLHKRHIKSKTHSAALEFDQMVDRRFKKAPAEKVGTKENKKKILEVNLIPDLGTRNTKKTHKNHDSKGSKHSGSGSQDSGEGKLGKLLSSQNYEKKKSSQEEDQSQNTPQESYTFSAVMSATSVRQRPRIGRKEKDLLHLTGVKHVVNEEDQIVGNDREDDAFIFFRPKKSRR